MAKVYLGLGTNLGDKENNLRNALTEIERRVGNVVSLSAFYETTPWGFVSDNSFLNAVACIETPLCPQKVLQETKIIEKELGRTEKTVEEYTDRLIDIDILLYDDLILCEEGLVIPHPLMTSRAFVMEPLSEIAPELIHPLLLKKIKELVS